MEEETCNENRKTRLTLDGQGVVTKLGKKNQRSREEGLDLYNETGVGKGIHLKEGPTNVGPGLEMWLDVRLLYCRCTDCV